MRYEKKIEENGFLSFWDPWENKKKIVAIFSTNIEKKICTIADKNPNYSDQDHLLDFIPLS